MMMWMGLAIRICDADYGFCSKGAGANCIMDINKLSSNLCQTGHCCVLAVAIGLLITRIASRRKIAYIMLQVSCYCAPFLSGE